MAKCVAIGYGFLSFSFSSLEELEADAVTLLKRIRKFSMAQDIGARTTIHIFNRISFAIAKKVGAQIVSRLPSNLLRSNQDDVLNISTSFFVTNFPEQTTTKELWRLCKQYGNVIDVFIPNMRSKL
nr:probable LRR receptor-like serine/threonine-protein kinase At3g47570 [Tanacetum cinerariifolium]